MEEEEEEENETQVEEDKVIVGNTALANILHKYVKENDVNKIIDHALELFEDQEECYKFVKFYFESFMPVSDNNCSCSESTLYEDRCLPIENFYGWIIPKNFTKCQMRASTIAMRIKNIVQKSKRHLLPYTTVEQMVSYVPMPLRDEVIAIFRQEIVPTRNSP